MKKSLSSLILGSAIAISGCDELSKKEEAYVNTSNKKIVCTIIGEKYVSSGLQEVNEVHIRGFISEAYSGPSLTTRDSIYLLKLQSPAGNIFSLNVIDSYTTPKESIDQMFNEGDKIAFRAGNNWIYTNEFGNKNVAADTAETAYYQEGDLLVTRRAQAISRP